jgi:hypothetical protein
MKEGLTKLPSIFIVKMVPWKNKNNTQVALFSFRILSPIPRLKKSLLLMNLSNLNQKCTHSEQLNEVYYQLYY